MRTPAEQLAALNAIMPGVHQGTEALHRARKITERCYPNWTLNFGNPFVDSALRAEMMSPERGDYVLLQRAKFKEIQARLLAKIVARSLLHERKVA